MPRSLIVHAGAWDIPVEEVEAHLQACRRALAAGWAILQAGGSAMDAAQAAVIILEDDPALDAGRGSVLTAEGTVELDAGLMRGSDLKSGAVATVSRIRNPILLARQVLDSPYVMLTGTGAENFAAARGMSLVDPSELIVERERENFARWKRGELRVNDAGDYAHDTVGAVAMDAAGCTVAAVSTGGTPFTPAGRVGDVPQAGCGFYADDRAGGAVSTGHGESIARVVMAKYAVDCMRSGQTAGEPSVKTIAMLHERVRGTGGLICIDTSGRPGVAFNTRRLAHGYIGPGMTEGRFGV
jgi:beta-aspartyl-peptidase (threonine type)